MRTTLNLLALAGLVLGVLALATNNDWLCAAAGVPAAALAVLATLDGRAWRQAPATMTKGER